MSLGIRVFDEPGYVLPNPTYEVAETTKGVVAVKPIEVQIEEAAGCLIGYLRKMKGCHSGRASDLEGLIREIQPSIHARGRRFGACSEDVCITLLAALKLLEQRQTVRVIPDDDGYGIALKDWSPNRKRPKYVNNRNRARRVA